MLLHTSLDATLRHPLNRTSANLMSKPAEFCSNKSMQKAILAFVDDVYEDLELWYPLLRLQEAGYAFRHPHLPGALRFLLGAAGE